MSKNKILLISVILSMCLLGGCGKEAETVEPEAITTETVVEEEPAVEEETAQVAEKPSVEKETVVEEPEEVVPQNVGEWSISLDRTEPKLTIWNDTTKEGTVLENGNEYAVKEGDQLVICYDGEETNFEIWSSIVKPYYNTSYYKIYNIPEIPTESTKVEFLQTVNGVEYFYSVYIIAE